MNKILFSISSARSIFYLFFSLVFACKVLGEFGDSVEPNGLGGRIKWTTLNDGYEEAKENNKPLMLILHKSWCGACKSLKPLIAESDEIFELSKKFVMVNIMDQDPPESSNSLYSPDGGYIPRILFFDPNGKLMKDEINAGGNDAYKYYYYDAESVLESMTRVQSLIEKKYGDRTEL